MKQQFLILTLLAGLLTACSSHAQSDKDPDPRGPGPYFPDKNKEDVAQAIRQLQMAVLVDGNNQFAVDMYQQLGKKPGNKFFSPYSISAALGMTYAGARGQTAKEMAATLHFTLDQEQLHPEFGELIRKIQGADKKRNFQLSTANSLWGDKSFSIKPDFLRLTQTDYQAGFQSVDFTGDAEGARKKINGWVEDKTNNKIKELFKPGVIQSMTRLVLVNAVYFKADWLSPFDKKATRLEDFTLSDANTVQVPMMNKTLAVKLARDDDFLLAEIPYKDKEVSMVVILPTKKDGLAVVEKKLSAKMLREAGARTKSTNVKVSLPRFKMTEAFSLKDDLSAMGLITAFTPAANFSGISGGSLWISAVEHKAFVAVDEEGTEAAAATGVVMGRTKLLSFKADHPFLFLIRHNATGSILFMGRVCDPR